MSLSARMSRGRLIRQVAQVGQLGLIDPHNTELSRVAHADSGGSRSFYFAIGCR